VYPPELDWQAVKEKIISELKSYFETNGFEKGVVGLSGGLDSSTVAYLAADALGVENLYTYIMPTKFTSQASINDAMTVIKKLEVPRENWQIINIEPIVHAVRGTLNIVGKKDLGNAIARIRMVTLYHKAAENNALVIGTGDKSELLLGYFTKYGDGGVDILPIGDIYKTQLRKFANYLGVPESIVKKPSSPELWPGHKAEDELGVTYDEVDPILYLKFDLGYTDEQIIEKLRVGEKIINLVNEFVRVGTKENILGIVRREIPPFVGSDGKEYGPFSPGDIIMINKKDFNKLKKKGMVEDIKIDI